MSFQNEIFTKFFDCSVKDLFVNNFKISSPLIGTYLSAFKEVTKDFEIVDTRNWHGDFEYPPLYEVIQLNSQKSEEFLLEGIQFFKVAGNNHVSIKFDVGWMGVNVSVITNNENREWNKELLEKVHKWAFDNNYLRGEKFALSGEFVEKTNKEWKDVTLDKDIKTIVQQTTEKVISSDAKSRGMLFVGPPGTGKTMTGKIMKDTSDSTFIWVSAKDMFRIGPIGALKIAFRLARDLSPTILFIEDIDEWLYDGATDLLKTEMDGIQENKGLITVLTSNYPERMPDALLDRPGRFHEIVKFDLPNSSVRKEMLTNWLNEEVSDEIINDFVQKTEGYSGAYMREVVDYAKSIAEDEEISLVDAFVKSLKKIEEQKLLIQEIRQNTKSFDTIEIKEGRIISKKNRQILQEAKEAIEKILEIQEPSESSEDVKNISQFIPETKKVTEVVNEKPSIKKRKVTERELATRILQRIAKTANEGLHQAKKSK